MRASDAIDFDVAEGETHAVIGPNGAGKTTFIGQLAGNLRPDAGRIAFAGEDITRLPAARRARKGLARSFQITSVYPEFTALQNVALAVQAHSGHSFRFWRDARNDAALLEPARRVLEEVGFEQARFNMLAGNLAHGEQRQLEVAMALATRPRLLLLDEPMAGMGTEESQRMIALLAGLKRRQTHRAGRARHGRRVPPRRPHLGAGVRARHRHRHAGEDPRQRGSAARLPGRGRLMLEVRDLETAYGRSQVLFGISFDIRPGEVATLLGRNGMGKTTTVRSIMGLTPPQGRQHRVP